MKKILFSNVAVTMLMAFTASFTLSSCSEEIVEDKQENQEAQEENLDIPKDVTVFTTAVDEATRTSIGLDAKFYWTDRDKIWVDVAEDGSFSAGSDEMKMADDMRTAKFYFSKTMDADTFKLTYTGINSTSGNKVTIPQDQSQNEPNDSTSIGRNGDCATAVAKKNAKGQYEFTLRHKAHYLIFQPFKDIPKTWKLKKIEIIDLDGKPLCGTYDFATTGDFGTTGLIASSVTNAKDIVKISIGGADGWALPQKNAFDPTNGSWYAVIAPATDGKRNLRIKYTIDPDAYINFDGNGTPTTKGDMVIVKDLTIKSAANKVTKIAHKMTMDIVPTDEFYQWDAVNPYWYGIDLDKRPFYYAAQNVDDYPKDASDANSRYTTFSTNAPSTGLTATNSPCSDLPNVNALTWYAMAGDARWEKEYPWCFDNNFDYIYTLGTWFKKWDVIVSENSVLTGKSITNCDVSFKGTVTVYLDTTDTKPEVRTYDGRDYRIEMFPKVTVIENGEEKQKDIYFQPRFQSYKTDGRPKDTSNYFFMPANSHLTNGRLDNVGVHGCYWSSSAVPASRRVYIIEMKDFSLQVRQDNGNPVQGRPAPTDRWK